MRFLGSKFTQNTLAAGAPPQTPPRELKRSPRPLADFRGEKREKREEGKGKRVLGKGKREEREGKRGGRKRGRRRERKGRGSLCHWR